jgi:hypothetical protein
VTVGELANRIVDPVILVTTLVLFFALWRFVPRLAVVGSAILASSISAITFTTFVETVVPALPSDTDPFFVLLICALIQCGFAAFAVPIWRNLRAYEPEAPPAGSSEEPPAFMKIQGRLAAKLDLQPGAVRPSKRFSEPWMVMAAFVAVLAVLMILALLFGSS